MTNNAQLHELGSWLSKASPIHFIGAGGSGMRPLAEFTASFGVAVTGSDRSVPGQKSQILFAAEGTPKEKELIERANTIVFSSAISDDHPSLALSRTLGKSTLHRSELLAIFTRHHQTITVAGTHGKSTTSALVAHCLKALGSDPSWIIGAPFSDGQDSWRKGASPVLVIEADESDGSFLRYTSASS